MKCKIEPGKYIVAVSGGVDSMVLLEVLARRPDLELVVAHYDHGIRDDSRKDQLLVAKRARELRLPYIYEEGKLSPQTSEATARTLRYDFLERARKTHKATAIITAHHQDDVLETMLLNLLRGTGRRGLTSLQSTSTVVRPLLQISKAELRQYAEEQNVQWREDSTNQSNQYARNRIRHTIMSKLTVRQRQQLISLHAQQTKLNTLIDSEIAKLARGVTEQNFINRLSVILLPHNVSLEFMAHLLRTQNAQNIDRKLLDRLVIAVKTARPHSRHDVDGTTIMIVDKKTFYFAPRAARKTR